jgi:hypothetical protein
MSASPTTSGTAAAAVPKTPDLRSTICLAVVVFPILIDFQISTMFLRSGVWTFQVDARLGDNTCLFAMSLTQWLDGRLE